MLSGVSALAPTAVESLTAVISNWETTDYTTRCVDALVGDGVPAGRIVIVDNGSRDDSFERLSERFTDAVVLRLEENVGYARAMNHGARALPGSAYLLLNSDAFLHRRETVAAMLAALTDETVGIVVPRLLNEDLTLQPTVMPTNSPSVALARASGLSRLIPNRWQPRWSTHWDHSCSREIQGADGAVVLVRGEAWRELGGFDEQLRMYAEDLDLCWRARKRGWKIWFLREAEFVHLGAGATRKYWGSPRRAELIGESESRMIARNLPRFSAMLTIAFIRGGLALRVLVFRLLGRREAAASLRAALRAYRLRAH
jgi:N-acetylglucosaminyl-diphospho-decaprenol L-rhamnosyltransferase